ncbi:MAG: hypothetical protein AB8V23_01345 [Candidatus Midichloria sp.]|uniref:Uncharacterized protein n=1 Tax=Hyalomma marginatum TaxID=34627 RepID=A0A8S4BWL1_9ACAR|nr:hypothetical protein MHYMCMPASI_00490 [Hyalomma marginatum]
MTGKTSYLGSIDRDQHLFVATSMFETDKITVHAASYLNEYFDIVSVPESFLVKVYQRAGCTPIILLASSSQLR